MSETRPLLANREAGPPRPGVIRVRFHGRGGQGMKTASRILGTAALLDGFTAQDSPVYGAERRGAPMTAYTRIGSGPIVERGVIPAPHLVVVADDTLLDDPGASPLAGLPRDGALLIATAHSADEVRRHTGHVGPVAARDFVDLALTQVGDAAAVSAALGAAAAALLGLSAQATASAVRTELAALGLAAGVLEANVALGARARADVTALPLPDRAAPPPVTVVVDLAGAPPDVATPSVTASPNTALRATGSWRLFRPVIDLARCTRCWICFLRCPDGAIDLETDDTPRIEYAVCKGCLICAVECPIHGIATVREVREWA